MDEKKLAEILIGEPALSWKMRENGYFVVVDEKGKKIIFTPAQVEVVQNKPRAKLAEAKPESEATEAKPKRSYKPRAKKA